MSYFPQPQHSLELVPCLEINHDELDIRETIDRGSYGVVKIAFWREDEVAVKIFETQTEIEAFYNEVEVLASVSHPNIIELYGASKSKLPYYMIMELANEGSLYNVLHKMRNTVDYDEEHVFTWCNQISLAMTYLHDMKPKPIIHRDLKSSNVLLKDQVVKLCDFGTACDNHTLMTNAKGTVAWMAPEVISTTTYNEKCDVYSFGVMIWELVMRRIPFEKYNQYQIMRKVTENQRPHLPDSIPSSIRLLITQCWSQDPAERPGFKQVSTLLGLIKPHLKPLVHAPPSPPRFPDTPSSSTPSPVSGPTNYTVNNGSIRPLDPLPHVPESCALFTEHSQLYEDLSALLSHVDRKRGTMRSLEEQYKELTRQEKICEQSKEEKQIKLMMLRSENEGLNNDIHAVLDN